MNGLTFFTPAQYAADFYPFADGRDAQDLLWGGRTLGEQWAGQIPFPVAINPLWIPSRSAFDFVAALLPGEGWHHGGTLLAQRPGTGAPLPPQQLPTPPDLLVHPTDLFTRCGEAILAANTNTSIDGSTAGSGADTIEFAAALSGETITLGGLELEITEALTIDASFD